MGHAKGGVIPAMTLRVVDAGPDGCYIPMSIDPGRANELLTEVARRMYGGENETE